MDFVAAIFGALLKWLAAWWGKRTTAKSIEAANDRQAAAGADASQVRDDSDAEQQKAREQTAAGVDAVRDDAIRPDGLQRARDEAAAATERANAAGRLQ